MSSGIFGDLFDLNNDGKIDSFESGLEFMFLNDMMESENDSSDESEED